MIMTDPHNIKIISSPDQQKCRIDKFITENVSKGSYSRSRIKTLIQEGNLSCDGKILDDPSMSVKPDWTYHLVIPAIIEDVPQAEDIKLSVLYEDADLIVINKPAGLVVHPAPGSRSGTLVNALLHHCGKGLTGIGGVSRPGIVHRLDKNTSGVMVVAKSQEAHIGLSALFSSHRIHRKYDALCWGVPSEMSSTINAPLGRHSFDRKKQTIRENGRPAITHYQVLKLFPPFGCHIACSLETGRTHQIRVHLTSIGHSIIGDETYGRPQRVAQMPDKLSRQALASIRGFRRQALHASELSFVHPVSNQKMDFKAALPEDLNNLHSLLEKAVWERGHTNL